MLRPPPDMMPNHHPHPETLVSYASGTLSSAASCVVACHLSMCSKCAEQIRWLERVGGVMLSNLETDDAEMALTERIVAQRCNERQPQDPILMPGAKGDDLLLPVPLARYLDMKREQTSWKPSGNAVEERSIALPKHSGSIKLLRLSPGQPLAKHGFASETEVALVLQGACRDSAGTYVRGDIIEWGENPPHPPMASGEAECVCLIADQTTG